MADSNLTHCANCEYDLSGLGRQGRCPECGQYFDRLSGQGLSTRSVRMSDRHQRGDRLVRRLRTVVLALLAISIMACGGSAVLFTDDWHYGVGIASVIAGVVALAAVTSFLYEKDES